MYSISKPSTLNHLQPNPDRVRKQPTAFAAAATCIRPLHPGSPFHSYPSVRLPPPLKLSVARISPPSTPPHHASTHSDHADLHTRTCSWSHPCSNTWIHLCTHMAVPVSMPVNASLSLSPLSLSLPPSLPSNLSIYLKSPASTDSAAQPSLVSAPSRVFFASFLSGSRTFHFSRPSDLKPHVCPPKPRHSPHSCTKLQPLIASFCIPIYACYAE